VDVLSFSYRTTDGVASETSEKCRYLFTIKTILFTVHQKPLMFIFVSLSIYTKRLFRKIDAMTFDESEHLGVTLSFD